jgi:hypothetical protein
VQPLVKNRERLKDSKRACPAHARYC